MRKREGLFKVRTTTKGGSVVALFSRYTLGVGFAVYRIKQTVLSFE